MTRYMLSFLSKKNLHKPHILLKEYAVLKKNMCKCAKSIYKKKL